MIIKYTHQVIVLLGILLLLTTCQRVRDVQPLDDYYGYLKTDSITLKVLGNRKPEVVLTVDRDSLFFSAIAYDKDKKSIINASYTFWVNGQPLPSNAFLPDKEGEYKVVARLGHKTSEAILVKAIDPVKQVSAVRLKVSFSHGELIADNLSALILNAELLDASGQRVNFNYRNALTFYIDNKIYSDTIFRTSKAGNFSFKVRAFNKESEVIVVKALTITEASIVTLPIIFHLFNIDISQAKLQAQIDILNKTFRDSWNPNIYPKADRHADLRLQFKLADVDPNGKPMPIPGRDYIDAGKKQYHSDETMGDLGWQHYWNPDYYINAFVADYSNDVYGGVNWAAAGSYPVTSQPLAGVDKLPKGSPPAFLYAMHIRHYVFDNQDPKAFLSGVITHEMGHMLGLPHTFRDNDCNGDSDYCEDTPVYHRLNNDSGANEHIACDGQKIFSTNYMDYISIANMFTLDQSTRARHVVNYGLWLPTSFNRRTLGGGRQSAAPGYVQRPAVIAKVKPVACSMQLNQ